MRAEKKGEMSKSRKSKVVNGIPGRTVVTKGKTRLLYHLIRIWIQRIKSLHQLRVQTGLRVYQHASAKQSRIDVN